MEKYSMALIQPIANTVYPNTEAHAELKAMMNRYKSTQKKYTHRPKLFFWVDKEGYECIYVESGTISSFKYRLNPDSFVWIINFLRYGDTEETDGLNPMAIEKREDSDANKFGTEMLKLFVENNLGNIQFVPEMRDYPGKQTAIASFPHGVVSFRVERTEELTDYLREKGLIR